MLARFEIEHKPGPQDFMKMRRARRFRSEPDHATRDTLPRTPEEKIYLAEVNRHKTEVDLKAARTHIQEALSGELLIDDIPKAVKSKPVLVWALVDKNGFSILRSGEKPFTPPLVIL